MAMNFGDGVEEHKCEDCSSQGSSATFAYKVVETRHLCKGCARKRANILQRDVQDQNDPSIGKTLSLECKHCTVGICSACEIVVWKKLEKLSLRDSIPPKDIKNKTSLRVARELELPGYIKYPRICCITEDTKVVIVDADSGSLYLTDLGSGEVVRIVPNGPTIAVSDCTTANRKELMFSNLASGLLTLCNMSGKPLCDISLPDQKPMREVFLGTNSYGHIMAARKGESSSYIVDTLNEKITGTVSLKGRTVCRGIQAASSNKFIVGIEWAEFVVVGVNGEQTTISDRNWFHAECGVHPKEDLLYVLYSRSGADPQVVHLDEVTVKGEIKRKSILSFKMKGPLSRPVVTSRMEFVVCDGRTILVFE